MLFSLTLIIHLRNFLDSDEGLALAGAWNIFNGLLPYTDFFTYKTPGSFYLVALLIKIFGPSYWMINLFAIIILFLSLIGIFIRFCFIDLFFIELFPSPASAPLHPSI